MDSDGAVNYADGWTNVLILEPGETVTLPIPDDEEYLYILDNNGKGESLLPQNVKFSRQQVELPGTYMLDLNISTYKGCLTGGSYWTNMCGNDCYQFDLTEIKAMGYSKMTVTANESGRSFIAMFTEQMPTGGVSDSIAPKWAEGWSNHVQISAGQTDTFEIPDNGAYLYVLYSGTNVSRPDSIVFGK